ncbi:hypothetical protein ACLOJK_004123 [Asimina triloba]
MIAFRIGIPLESPMHKRVLGNDKLDLSTLVCMKLCQKKGNQYQPVNEDGTSVPPPDPRVKEHITKNDSGAGPSQPKQSRIQPGELNPSPPSQVTLDVIMDKLNSIVDEMGEYHSSVSFNLADIENKPNTVMTDSDED